MYARIALWMGRWVVSFFGVQDLHMMGGNGRQVDDGANSAAGARPMASPVIECKTHLIDLKCFVLILSWFGPTIVKKW